MHQKLRNHYKIVTQVSTFQAKYQKLLDRECNQGFHHHQFYFNQSNWDGLQ